MKPSRLIFIFLFICLHAYYIAAQENAARRTGVAVLDFGTTETGRRAADTLAATLRTQAELQVMDRDEGRAAAFGSGYRGSLNMTLEEARNTGSAIGSDFYITGDAQTLRRSPSSGPIFYEAYASIFVVSSRTGRLVMWERPSLEAPTPEEAEQRLLKELTTGERRTRYLVALVRAVEDESRMRALTLAGGAPVIEEVPEEGSPAAAGVRPPAPYRRQRPAYPDTAKRAEAEATVDVMADIDENGEVSRVEVVRWAGFGLDEETVNTVRRMHFYPAMRDGVAISMRVLLRYNFRKPPR
jgi:TonB family protein